MIRKYLIILGIICSLIGLIVLSGTIFCKQNLSGHMLLGEFREDHNDDGVIIFDLKTKTLSKKKINISCFDYVFSRNKNELFLLRAKSNYQPEETVIYKYNTKNNYIDEIVKCRKNTAEEYYNLNLVASKGISYIIGESLWYYDFATKNETRVLKHLIGDYCWNREGTDIIYSAINGGNVKIYRYDMKSEVVTYLFDGYDPQYSNDNDYIAYHKDDRVYVRNVASKRIWSKKVRGFWSMQFSPDGKYVAIVQGESPLSMIFHTFKYIYGQEMIVWDFKSRTTKKLISHIKSGYLARFDWK